MWELLPLLIPDSNSQAQRNVPTLDDVATAAKTAVPADVPAPSSWRKQSFFTSPGALPDRAPVPTGTTPPVAPEAEAAKLLRRQLPFENEVNAWSAIKSSA